MTDDETILIEGNNPICISFSSPVKQVTAGALMAALSDAINAGRDEIHLFLSTPGGTVQDGIAVYNFIRALPAPTIVYNVGSVNSIGNAIYQSGSRKIAAPVSSFMFHGVGFDIQNARFELKELRERMSSVENDQALIADIMVQHTSLKKADVDALFLEMAHLRASEAQKRGITDEIREIRLPKGISICQLVFQ